jgi:hypothetical protein
MRCLVIRMLAVATAAAGLTAVSLDSAFADTVCQQTDPATGECLIWIEVPDGPGGHGDPDDDGPKDTGAGAACHWDGTEQGISKPPPGPVPCSSEYGYWSNVYHCYVRLAEPQPPVSDPAWQGHEPGDGAVYQCYQPQTDMVILIWAQDPPADAGTGPTPREVAEIAIDQMNLRAIDIGIVPEPGPDSVGLVGMPVWMWAANPDSHTYGPITASASAGGITITATARVHEITWDMGDGAKVVCLSAGTPYKPIYGKKRSPDCGHTYTTSSSSQPEGKFAVTATSDWVVMWEGAGQSGTIRLNGLQRSVQVTVGEAQVLVR